MFSELKLILRHSLVYGTGRLLDRLAALLLIPILVHHLSPEEWGVYLLILAVAEILAFLYRKNRG